MAGKSTPGALRQANLSIQQMEEAIPKIDRRLADLAAFDPNAVDERSDPTIDALESKLETLIAGVFGNDTAEYAKYKYDLTHLDRATVNIAYKTPLAEVRQGLQRGKDKAIAQLQAIKSGFLEELADAGVGGSAARALKAYEGLELHPAIERSAGQLYRDGHYASAIENAVKALNGLVRLTSGVDDKDGTHLMEFVFNPTKPLLKFNGLADQSDRDEQKGFMMLFSGAVAGLRNPRAHRIVEDDAEMALEFIAFVSLLAKLADKAKA